MEGEVLFARAEHGGHRITRLKSGISISWPQGAIHYDTTRKAIMALYNGTPEPPKGAYDPHLCFDRYFRRGRYQRRSLPTVDVLELFRADPPNQVSISIEKPALKVAPGLTVHIPLGIDLSKRAGEVRKLFYAGFARRVLRMGYDPNDVLQDIYMGILARNKGICPFDAQKSSFGHYVHMVAGCILSNYRRRHGRWERNEQLGVRTFDGEVVDVAEADFISIKAPQEDYCSLRSSAEFLEGSVELEAVKQGVDPKLAKRCVQYLAEGMLYREIAAEMGCSISNVSGAAKVVRSVTQAWRNIE